MVDTKIEWGKEFDCPKHGKVIRCPLMGVVKYCGKCTMCQHMEAEDDEQ